MSNYWNKEGRFEEAIADAAFAHATFDEDRFQRNLEELKDEKDREERKMTHLLKQRYCQNKIDLKHCHKLCFVVANDESHYVSNLPKFLPGCCAIVPVHELECCENTIVLDSGGWGIFDPTDPHFPLPESICGVVSWINQSYDHFEVIDAFSKVNFDSRHRSWLDFNGDRDGGDNGPFNPYSEYHKNSYNAYSSQPKKDDYEEDNLEEWRKDNAAWEQQKDIDCRREFNAYITFFKGCIDSN